MHSSFGVVSIHGKDVGDTWISVKNGGHQIFYEIKAGNAQLRLRYTQYVHLSLYKDGSSFNGYMMQGPNTQMELLHCRFAV